MKLNDLVIKIDDLRKRLSKEDAKTLEQFNDLNKFLYLQMRHLASRDDLGYWYQKIAKDTINHLDEMFKEEVTASEGGDE